MTREKIRNYIAAALSQLNNGDLTLAAMTLAECAAAMKLVEPLASEIADVVELHSPYQALIAMLMNIAGISVDPHPRNQFGVAFAPPNPDGRRCISPEQLAEAYAVVLARRKEVDVGRDQRG